MSDKKLIEKYIPKEKQQKAFKKLEKGYPVQYIIGNVEFYNLTIKVNKNVLIPRFETEYLVDDVIRYVKKLGIQNPSILDIATGSGCIALALKKNLNGQVDAYDKSSKALKVAMENAKINNLDINFFKDNIKKHKAEKKYDVIVSNPPYVKKGSPVDKKIKYEPKMAIYAKDDGLYFYKIILQNYKDNLNKKSILAFEIGDNQGNILTTIAKSIFPNSNIILKKDLNNYDRYLFIINE